MSDVILVRDVMTRDVKTVRTDSSLNDAVQKMNKFNIGSVVVMDSERKRVLGIITERDVLRSLSHYSEPLVVRVKQVMSHPVVTVDFYSSIEDTARLMSEKNIKRIPVMEGNVLVGIISSSDIIRASPTLVKTLTELIQ